MKQLASGKKVDWNSINANLSKRQQSAVRAAAREKGAEIFTPNRWRKRGDPSTKRTATLVEKTLRNQEFDNVKKEVSFKTPNSFFGKTHRDVDVFGIDHKSKSAVIVQVVRTIDRAKRTPHPREFDAVNDILNSPKYKDLLSQGFSIEVLMVRRGAKDLSNPLRTF